MDLPNDPTAEQTKIIFTSRRTILLTNTMFSLQTLLCTFLLVATATASLFPTKSSRLALQTAAEERRNIHSSPLRGNPFDLRQRSLVEACQDDDIGSCVFQAIFDDDVDIYSSCGGLAEANDRWW